MSGVTTRFLNRSDELAVLEEQWRASGARYFVLWGRRRVGKTELLDRFVAGKRSFFFEANDTTEVSQLRAFSEELATVSGNALLAAQPVTNWTAALAALEQFVSSGERTVVVFDEFQFLVARQAGLETLLNSWWRTTGSRRSLVLIIAGSEVSFFRQDVLAGKMYGRRTGQWQLAPFEYRAAALFTPSYSAADKVRTYAVCGGMPYYLNTWDDSVPLEQNILRNILYRDGLMHEEAEFLLRQELPDPRQYFAVLEAIARGRRRNNAIVQHTGLDKAQVYQHLRTLERLQLVEQRRPVTAKPTSLKTSYAILDGYLNFYFTFVEPFASRLRNRADAELHLRQTVIPRLDHFVSKPAWEYICRQYMRIQEPDARTVGGWWGSVPVAPRRNEQRELDAAVLDIDGRVIATASCKWTNAPLDYSEETLLTQLEAFIPGAEHVRRHYFFSRSGFSDSLTAAASSQPDRIRLVAPDDLYASGESI
jgi:AAA+ ATPase superfamily predicted ATPase